ncbi:dihydropteroate synthase [Diaminobutyricimonas sp. TR449]|uniref:dihydropteroate synthase n=1 Tax=Diaminobutyricimonas sp. TR449 TaxID=2708076 RepID=UPI001FBA6F59|nr:dihydropteroate synthase [Diaminobutyricimonas sp. TR449]
MTLPAVGEAAGPVGLQGSALLSPVPGSPVLRSPVLRSPVRTIGAREFDFDRQIAVMAIVNRTPDSFYDRGRTFALDRAVEAALAAVGDGADWVDIGGVKFAPGAPVPVEVEAERVLPVVRAVHEASDVVISVDTFHTAVARQAIVAGASVINDTTGLSDPELAHVVADSDATLVIAHSLARPRTAYPRPEYADVAAEVSGFLRSRVELAVALGVPEERIVVDPGHDLNKNTRHSLELSRRLGEICALGLPTLVALSNKDFIGETLGRPIGERLAGSLAAAVACVLQGARIVRVHEVAPTVDAMRMVEGILGWREPALLRHNMGDGNE